tara:strand:- start:4216 stop:4641 length:426 start_codon:yes stop_codon:yes gene_type:complete
MALPVTDMLITQLMKEGDVARGSVANDLSIALGDRTFSQLLQEYGNISGNPSKESTPMISGLMKESAQVPKTPLEQEQKVATGGPAQTVEEINTAVKDMSPKNINVPTPMSDAMAQNTMAPLGTLTAQNRGLMSNSTQQIA